MRLFFYKHPDSSETQAAGPLVQYAQQMPDKKSFGRVFTSILFGFIMFFLFVSILIGIQTYRSINTAHSLANETLLGVSLIANSISFNDSINAVSVGQGPEGRALVLTENLNGSSYETRFYAYQGNVVQEYTASENPYTPQASQVVATSKRFDFTFDSGLITIWLDHSTSNVALRSYQGEAQ